MGYHNPEVISPTIDSLATSGVILDRNYVQPVCTPSRASLLSGMYPYKIGRQVIQFSEYEHCTHSPFQWGSTQSSSLPHGQGAAKLKTI